MGYMYVENSKGRKTSAVRKCKGSFTIKNCLVTLEFCPLSSRLLMTLMKEKLI